MYSGVLIVHSWVRWAVIITGLVVVARAVLGSSRRKMWTPADDRAGFWFTMTLDLQVLLGLILYVFLSPFTTSALQDFGAAMKTPGLRFWAVEHAFGMFAGLVLAHLGRIRVRKTDSLRRHTTAMVWFTLALLVILASIPWPGMANGRPLLRW